MVLSGWHSLHSRQDIWPISTVTTITFGTPSAVSVPGKAYACVTHKINQQRERQKDTAIGATYHLVSQSQTLPSVPLTLNNLWKKTCPYLLLSVPGRPPFIKAYLTLVGESTQLHTPYSIQLCFCLLIRPFSLPSPASQAPISRFISHLRPSHSYQHRAFISFLLLQCVALQ